MSTTGTTSKPNTGFHPHIIPLKVYLLVGASLFILTGVTVLVAQFDFGGVINLIIAMAVATLKASLVALFFMHLLYDNKLYMLIFLGSLLFLFVFISLTMMDTTRRGDIYKYQGERLTVPQAPAQTLTTPAEETPGTPQAQGGTAGEAPVTITEDAAAVADDPALPHEGNGNGTDEPETMD